MKSFKKLAGAVMALVLAFGMMACSSDSSSDDPVKETVATPTFSVAAGAVNSGTEVTISCATEGAVIHYTTDGSEPTAESTTYSAAISVTTAVTLKAIAVKDGMNDSAVASASYTIKGTVAKPTFSPAAGAVDSGTGVTISCATEGAVIHYTTDGSEPTAESSTYSEAISVTAAVTIKAIAVKNGMNNSAVASAAYTIYVPKYTVGDFVLKTGTRKSKDETPAADSVAAVIVRADTSTKPALGVGIVHNKSGLAWCTSSAAGYSITIEDLVGDVTSGYMDGSDSWSLLNTAVSNDAANNPDNYPAWKFCKDYVTGKGFSEALATGWYLPTIAELKTIYDNNKNNDGVIEASLTKAGGNTFVLSGSSGYWSCCQDKLGNNYAGVLRFYDGYKCDGSKNGFYGYVCAVRAFN